MNKNYELRAAGFMMFLSVIMISLTLGLQSNYLEDDIKGGNRFKIKKSIYQCNKIM